jgi:hypothetical protein
MQISNRRIPTQGELMESKRRPRRNINHEMDGSGLADLVWSALSHLVPSLLSKFGEKTGDVIGSIVGDKIKKVSGNGYNLSGKGYKLSNGGCMSCSSGSGVNNADVAKQKNVPLRKGMLIASSPEYQESKKLKEIEGQGIYLSGEKNRKGKTMKVYTGSGAGIDTAQNYEQYGSGLNEYDIKNFYDESLRKIQDKIGNNTTNNIQLDKVGKEMFKNKFGGVYSQDEIPKSKTKYYIVNTDTSDKAGTHWVAVADKYIYDSFGRNTKQLGKYFKKHELIPTNKNIEQSILENNCGQRCLAYLNTFNKYGAICNKII